ncbi:hypothetical protein [Maribacter polysaccharolyticus]|uniref:hypothetical protein n=1 Tax=Maribacter polysaccharolyticus TaxID=3020831 RepID=UPI00237F7771|nr:hypothetical protein [Maribacter polysaccharolyticus]MDE3744010.1 hypothetical protein [Maribacter polysaccharolyticus]
MNKTLDISDLYKKPASYKFNAEEIAFIKKHLRKSSFKAKYAIYKPESHKGIYIGFFIDCIPNSVRRSGIENSWDFLYERDITNIEYQELIENFGCDNRRFIVYQYRHIEQLVLDDLKYNVKTPDGFIKRCKELGYTGDFQLSLQLHPTE